MIERAGIATVVIGLIPQHVEQMRPPRALVVPFELGRPLGAPDAPEFQREVLEHALTLGSRTDVPVLETFPKAAPAASHADSEEGWACPISLPDPDAEGGSNRQLLRDELARTRPWYEKAQTQRGRTAFGMSGLEPKAIVDFLADMEAEPLPPSPVAELTLDRAFKLAADDLKQYYLEAATVRPGASSRDVAEWFWKVTEAGALLKRLSSRLAKTEDRALRTYAAFTLVPEEQAD